MKKEDAIKILKDKIKKGDILYTNVNHVSRSGMMRYISVTHINNNIPCKLDRFISIALDWKQGRNRFGDFDGIKVSGCGMDMGFHLIYTLSSALFDDGYAIKQGRL